uniref:Carboxypeptidase regulatory-like domain-containing protein n=1 Tax=Schlesneria paludicola TaxID=360056 RepID=A0A7C4LM64_9PLAN
MLRPAAWAAIWLGAAILSGCAQPDGAAEVLSTVPVSGTLTYQGQPLESYRVTLYPEHGDRASSGLTDAEGKFTLGTNREGDGAPPGRYRVVIAYSPPPSGDTTLDLPIEDPSQLPQPKIKIPSKYSSPEKSGLTQEVPRDGLKNWKLDLP